MVPHLRRILQRTGNTAPARDQLQYWMLREMDDAGLTIVCEVVNRYMRGERLEALSHGDLHLLPKEPPDRSLGQPQWLCGCDPTREGPDVPRRQLPQRLLVSVTDLV